MSHGPSRLWSRYIQWNCPVVDDELKCFSSPGENATLKLLLVSANVTISWNSAASPLIPLWEAFERAADVVNEKSPDSFKAKQSEIRYYRRMRTEQELLSATFQGCLIGLGMASLVLLAFTRDLVATGFAVIGILMSVLLCIAFLVVNQWPIGFIEAVCLVVCVGFSVDFVAHLAHSFVNDESTSRVQRVRGAIGRLGISILAAAVTTCGAAFFMFFGSLRPFAKLGMFIFFDVLSSLAIALMPFVAALSFGKRCCRVEDENAAKDARGMG